MTAFFAPIMPQGMKPAEDLCFQCKTTVLPHEPHEIIWRNERYYRIHLACLNSIISRQNRPKRPNDIGLKVIDGGKNHNI